MLYPILIVSAIFFSLGIVSRWLYAKLHLTSIENKIERLKNEAETIAEKETNKIILNAEKQAVTILRRAEDELGPQKQEIKQERREAKEEQRAVDKQKQELQERQEEQRRIENEFKEREETYEQKSLTLNKELEKISQLTVQQAKNMITQKVEAEAKKEAAILVEKIEKEAKLSAEKQSRSILINVMQRLATQVTSDIALTTVSLPNDEVKGKIIGKEGRNIRSLETLVGVDIIIDDTPEMVVISCFDPIRRVIAQMALERLVLDGRIHPIRIEEVVNQVIKEIGDTIYEKGESVLLDLGIPNVAPEMVKSLGRLHYRTSYGQNVLAHSKEVSVLAGMIAAEVGANAELARRGGLFHDVGKGMESDSDSTHVELGVELAKKIGESDDVINAIAAHHGDVPYTSVESIIVQMADAISASRPGARRENVESYIKRLEGLEHIAMSFKGVDKAFAVQSGRELRIMVNTDIVDDDKAQEIAKSVVDEIETQMKFPGRIRVTIIRESRFVEYAH